MRAFKKLSQIAEAIQQETGISAEQMRKNIRRQEVVNARILLSYIAVVEYMLSQTETARFLNVKQPAVAHYLRTMRNELTYDKGLKKRLEDCKKKLK